MTRSPVAVGIVEGQDPAVVRFALAEAVRLGRPLRIIHVVDEANDQDILIVDLFDALLDALLEDLLDELAHGPAETLAAVSVERVTRVGDAAFTLLAESDTVCRMVLGADHDALTATRWSEVSQLVALQAAVPVIVVPSSSPTTTTSGAGVFVAVDDAHDSDAQIAYAVEAAEQRGSGLSIVFGAGATSDYPGRMRHKLGLENLADTWRKAHPSVSIRVSVEGGHPVASCLAEASHASLLVVGRPVGRHPRIMSRSVAARILKDARVPVAVVPVARQAQLAPEPGVRR